MTLKNVALLFILPIFIFLSTLTLLSAQQPASCGTDEHMKEYFRKNPEEKAIYEAKKEIAMKGVAARRRARKTRFGFGEAGEQVITIPIHVIVIYPPGTPVGHVNNPSMEEIIKGVSRLNQDFHGLDQTPITKRGNCDPFIQFTNPMDMRFEFALAATDPAGNPTNGVTRLQSLKGSNYDYIVNYFDLRNIMNLGELWANGKYLNIILIPKEGGGVAGLSHVGMIGRDNFRTDDSALLVSTERFFDASREPDLHTLTHEVGHYLGLEHAFSCGQYSTQNYMDYPTYSIPQGYFSESQADYIREMIQGSSGPMLVSANEVCAEPLLRKMQGLWERGGGDPEIQKAMILTDKTIEVTHQGGSTKMLNLVSVQEGYKASHAQTNTEYLLAIENDQMKIVYQPVGNPSAGKTSYLENTRGFLLGSHQYVPTKSTVTLTRSPSSLEEDAGGAFQFTFTRSHIEGPLTVNFGVSGNASYNDDYLISGVNSFSGSSGEITIPSGSTSATVTVSPKTDMRFEDDETINLTILSKNHLYDGFTIYTIGTPKTQTASIVNDDDQSTVTLTRSPSSLEEDAGGAFQFTFTRSHIEGPLTVSFRVRGSATYDNDYVVSGVNSFSGSSGEITIPSGSTSATLTVSPKTDMSFEDNETIKLTIIIPTINGNPVDPFPYILGSPSTQKATINDDRDNPLLRYNNGVPLDDIYGTTYQGGLVFFVDTEDIIPGVDGFVAAPADLDYNGGFTQPWGCTDLNISGADGEGIGTGSQNTTDIVAACTEAGAAARICQNVSLNGYSDWFLPSREELNLMYTNLKLKGHGGFSAAPYWSSTEFEAVRRASGQNIGYAQDFNTGNRVDGTKSNEYRVRAIRAF